MSSIFCHCVSLNLDISSFSLPLKPSYIGLLLRNSITVLLLYLRTVVFSERELTFTFDMSLSVRLSSVTFVHPTQPIKIFGNVFMPFGTLAICDPSIKILRRSSQGTPSSGVKPKRGRKM